MHPRTVAVLSPGEMGAATGHVLAAGGARVVTCLNGRSQATKDRAAKAGIGDLPNLEQLVSQSEIVLSIVAPIHARAVAEQVATAVGRSGKRPLYVDCNAVSPATAREIEATITSVGAPFADVGIIGNPPQPGPQRTRYYASGEAAADVAKLSRHGLDVRVVGDRVGQASALKMCYAALTKGLTALATELHVAAVHEEIEEPLRRELESSQADLLAWVRRMVPTMPPKAWRWIDEMEEIAATFAGAGLTPKLLEGAADMYRLAEQAPEPGKTLEEVVERLAKLRAPAASAPSASGSARARSKAG